MIANNTEDACLICLQYFGIFKYPLTAMEIHRFTPIEARQDDVVDTLNTLVKKGKAFHKSDYFLEKDDDSWIEERQQGYTRAIDLLNRSKKYTAVVASFPFVRGIAISGSLSKFYASSNPDLDFFIITDKNRLWIARSLLHFFKKLTFITGHQHYFCMNYFIDTEAMQIEHPNLYSAIEVVTLLPAYNEKIIDSFKKENTWTVEYLPNYREQSNTAYLLSRRKHFVKHSIEAMINICAPESMNRFFMRLTDRKWRKKWRSAGYSPEEYKRAFRTTLHISKNHPDDYEKKVLGSLKENENKNGTS